MIGVMGDESLVYFEHIITNLKKCITIIVHDMPDIDGLQHMRDSSNDVNFQLLCDRLKIQAAAALKSLYAAGHIPLFDEIMKLDSMNPGSFIDVEKISQQYEDINDNIISARRVKEYIQQNKSKYPPRLPLIEDNELFSMVFKHKLSFPASENNDRLVALGNSVVNTIVAQIIFEVHPDLSDAKFKSLKNIVLSNSNLVQFSKDYSFDNDISIDYSFDASKLPNLFSDVFVAYIGALAKESDCDYSLIKAWLKLLIDPILKDVNLQNVVNDDDEVMTDDEGASSAKNYAGRLERFLSSSPAVSSLVYKSGQERNGSTLEFIVECMVEGVVVGKGKAPMYRRAKQEAAKDALTNNREVLSGFAYSAKGDWVSKKSTDDTMIVGRKPYGYGGNGNGGMVPPGYPLLQVMAPQPGSSLIHNRGLMNRAGGGVMSTTPVGGGGMTTGPSGLGSVRLSPMEQEGQGTEPPSSLQKYPGGILGGPIEVAPLWDVPYELAPLPEDQLDKTAKEKINMLFSKNKVSPPTYRNKKVGDKSVLVSFLINNRELIQCVDTNKKKAGQRIAMWLLDNPETLVNLGISDFFDVLD